MIPIALPTTIGLEISTHRTFFVMPPLVSAFLAVPVTTIVIMDRIA
jgi:hypothetical protein